MVLPLRAMRAKQQHTAAANFAYRKAQHVPGDGWRLSIAQASAQRPAERNATYWQPLSLQCLRQPEYRERCSFCACSGAFSTKITCVNRDTRKPTMHTAKLSMVTLSNSVQVAEVRHA